MQTRINLEALAKFFPSAPGAKNEQALGFAGLSVDLADCDFAHVLRLDVGNFGTTGQQITINPSTLAVTQGAGASVSATPLVAYNGEAIVLQDHRLVAMRIVSGPADDEPVALAATEFRLICTNGTPALVSVNSAGVLPGSGTWTLYGDTGAQSPAWVIEILVCGVLEP
jgi:hypothetical protein